MTGFFNLDFHRTHEASFDVRRVLGVPDALGGGQDRAQRPVLVLAWSIGADGRAVGRWQAVREAPL